MTAFGLWSLQEWQDYEVGLRPGQEMWLYRLLSGNLYWHPGDELFPNGEPSLAYAVVVPADCDNGACPCHSRTDGYPRNTCCEDCAP